MAPPAESTGGTPEATHAVRQILTTWEKSVARLDSGCGVGCWCLCLGVAVAAYGSLCGHSPWPTLFIAGACAVPLGLLANWDNSRRRSSATTLARSAFEKAFPAGTEGRINALTAMESLAAPQNQELVSELIRVFGPSPSPGGQPVHQALAQIPGTNAIPPASPPMAAEPPAVESAGWAGSRSESVVYEFIPLEPEAPAEQGAAPVENRGPARAREMRIRCPTCRSIATIPEGTRETLCAVCHSRLRAP